MCTITIRFADDEETRKLIQAYWQYGKNNETFEQFVKRWKHGKKKKGKKEEKKKVKK